MSKKEEILEQRIAELEAENARLRASLNARTAIAWAGMVSAAWRHSIDKYAMTIRELVFLIRRYLKTGTDATVETQLKYIEDMAGEILNKPIQPPLSPNDGLEVINVNDLLREAVEQFWHQPYSDIKIDLSLGPDNEMNVQISPSWFRKGLLILIDNSIVAMSSSPIKQMTFGTSVVDGQIEVSVADSGIGIPTDVLPMLFIQPVPKNEAGKGLGIGLLLAQMVFETYGGKLKLKQTNSQGTTFRILLPQAN